jgi:hypothetical protein
MCTNFWWENLKETDPLEDVDLDDRKMLQWILNE